MRTPHISVAPMMDWTDRHTRFFHRLISPNSVLYTEMITTGALLHGDRDRFLRFNREEHPVVIQLGGSNPDDLAQCAQISEDYGYDQIDLNCGCPSDRVQNGAFGACLMAKPDLVASCVDAMVSAVQCPVTVKCRIGIDHHDDFEFLYSFASKVRDAGAAGLTVHARKAWLKGLSPKENREIPPLNYDRVAELRAALKDFPIILNGGIQTAEETASHLNAFDGVMIGRAAYQNPWLLNEIEKVIFKTCLSKTRADIALEMVPYMESQIKDYGTPLKSISRHMIGLFQGIPGGRHWRRVLSTQAHKAETTPKTLIHNALERIECTAPHPHILRAA